MESRGFRRVPLLKTQMPVQSIVKIAFEPHPDYFEALDKLVPFAIKTLDLGKHWHAVSSIGSLRLDWSYNNVTEKYTYKIAEITIDRPSHIAEICIDRSIKFGGIIFDDIPWEVRDAIEAIMDEAWLYCSGKKNAQLNLFDMPTKPGELASKPGELESKKVDTSTLLALQESVQADLRSAGIKQFYIEDYLGAAGDTPSVEGFHEWQEEEDEEQMIAQPGDSLMDTAKAVVNDAISRSKGTRSKAKKEAVTA